jgi:hypothetical protein
MPDNQVIENRYPDGLPFGPPEYVKVEMTTKGAKWEIKAATTKRFAELFDELKRICAEKKISFEQG